jgi:predicted Rossmann fold flavoprotein
MQFETDVIIIGAGAAGLMCAIEASGRGRRVVVLDKAARAGTKILLSGGGRCNFTNRKCGAENYVSENPRFCLSALKRFSHEDAPAMIERYGLAWEERELGRLFLKKSASGLVEKMVGQCREQGVEMVLKCAIGAVRKTGGGFCVETSEGEFGCESLVVATGGLSYPQSGASDLGHRLARQFGLAVVECQPVLVGLNYGRDDKGHMSELTGIAIDAAVSIGGKRFAENVLFTHEGLSGPAILQASVHWRAGEAIEIDWLPGVDVGAMLDEMKREHGGRKIGSVLAEHLPKRFVEQWSARYFSEFSDKSLSHYTREELSAAAGSLSRWSFRPSGTAGYRKAEAARGGVDTRELSSKTMQANAVKGLYFIGEVVDVTGQLGGYNLQWAWSSGWAAGQDV